MIQRPKYNEIGLTEADNKILIAELTKYAEEGASDDELKSFRDTFVSEKKKSTPKDGIKPQSMSTTKAEKSVSVPTDGSLGTLKPKIKDERLEGVTQKDVTATVAPRKITTDEVKLKREDEAFKQLTEKKVAEYRQATKVPTEERQTIVDDLKAKKEKQGFLNGLQTGLKQGWNTFVDVIGVGGSEETKANWKAEIDPLAEEKKEASDFFKSQKIKATPSQIEQKADEIFVKNKTLQSKQDKINDYLGSLDEQEKTYLEVDAQKRFKTISKERQDASNRISLNEKYLAQLFEDQKNAMTEEDRALIDSEIEKITKYLDEDRALFAKSTDKLGTAQEEFDAFRRNYNKFENAKARIASSLVEGGISFVEGLDYLGTLGGNIGTKEKSEKLFEQTDKARQGIQEYREEFRPENKEITLDNFFQYSTDLLTNQAGTLLTMAGAGETGGASILGLGQAGQTYAEMRKANKNGKNYAPWQMALGPAFSGFSTGYFSASPTYETLINAKNVWKSALKDPLAKGAVDKAIKGASNNIANQIYKDTKREIKTEFLDNLNQNAIKRDILGDKSVGYFDNSWQVLKDTFLMTNLLNIGALPQVTMSAVKMFSKPESNKALDANGQKIAQLLPQLDNEDISETSRKAIQSEIDKATAENTEIINSTLGKIANLPDSDVKKVVENNKKQGELISEAESIKEDKSIEPKAKQILLDAKKQEYQKVQESNNEIINAETQITTPESEVKSEAEVQKPTEVEKVNKFTLQEGESLIESEQDDKGRIFNTVSVTTEKNGLKKTKFLFNRSDKDAKQRNPSSISLEKLSSDFGFEIPKENIPEGTEVTRIKEIREGEKGAAATVVLKDTESGESWDAEIVINKSSKNESTPTTNTPTDGNIRPTTEQVGEVATEQKPTTEVTKTEVVESAVEPKTSKTTTKRVKSIKDSEYDIEFDEDDNDIKVTSVKTGKEINKYSIVKNPITGKERVIKNANYSKIVSDARGEVTKSQENTARKKEFDKIIRGFEPSNEYEGALFALANGAKVNVESLGDEVGNLDSGWATNKSTKEALPSIERLAEQVVSDNPNLDLDMQKVRDSLIEIIRSNQSFDQVKQSILDTYSENTKKQRQQEASAYLSGLTEEELAIFDSVTAEDDFINELTDEEAIEYFEQQYNVKTERYEPKSKQVDKGADAKSNSAKKSVGEKEPARKETRIKATEAKIDEIANSLKGLESVFGIKIKADLGDGKTQGTSRDALIDFIAKTAKEIAKTGIELDEAIRTVIDEIKKSFDTDIEVDDVKAKIQSEQAPELKADFERKQGKKSVLSRMAEGGNKPSIDEAIEKYELNYEVENQEVAKKNAEAFVKEVGFDKAFTAIKENKITGAEKAFVYNRLLEIVSDKMDSEGLQPSEKTKNKYKELFGFITNEFDKEARNAGQFISALNNVYYSSMLMYNLSNQIERHKKMGDGTIDEETLAMFKEADENIKRLEKEIKEAEKRANEAEEQLALKNIQEDIARKNKATPKSKSQQAKEIANKIRKAKINKPGIFSAATPGSLAWDGAIEVIAKTIEGGGTVADAVNKGIEYIRKSKWYQSLADEQKSEAERELRGYIRETTKQPFVSISEYGKIKIPEKIIRDYVEQGITDINDLSQRILEDIIEEYPDVTERQIRDAITRYGKTVNPSPDEIDAQIRKMKRIGKIVSGLEDAYSGKRPLRSGLQRDVLTPEERKMQRELKELLRDIPMDEADLQKTWKTALDAIKTRLGNQITDLENQIANREKRKPEKTPIEYDQDAKDLRAKVDSLKEALDEIVGKPELTEEQKIQKAVNGLEKSIESLTEQIANKQLEYKKRPSPIVSDEITRLRNQQKALRAEILQMRKDAGIVEKKRLETAKLRAQNQITELQKRIAEKDYAKREVSKIIPDDELTKLKAEKLKWQEVYDKDKYKQELKNRTINQKIIDSLFGVWNLPRVVMATGEMSWILIQGGVQSMSILTRNPSQFFGNLRRMIVAMGSADKANEWERKVKATDIYQIAKDSKLALTEVDHQLDVREEQFLGDYASAIWDLNGYLAQQIAGKKERVLIGDKIKQLFGSKKEYAKTASAREQIKNINPLRVLERGNTSYMNQLRLNRFIEGVEKLRLEGKDPVKDIDDYKALAKAINTLTGRANVPTFLKTTDPKVLAAIFFSFRNWVSKLNMLNPVFYYSLGNYSKPSEIFTKKPTVAQKIAITDMMRYITITTSMMYLIQAAAGKDDEGEDVISIETDPRSSDYMKMRMGDLRLDPWGGLQSTVTFLTRFMLEETKSTKTGNIVKAGEEYNARTRGQLFIDYASAKFNPSAGLIWEYMWSVPKTDENGETYRENKFGEKFSVADDVYNMKPMYWEAISEIKKEQPGVWGDFIIAAGALGINTQVYKKPEEGKKSGPPKLPTMPSMPKLPKMP